MSSLSPCLYLYGKTSSELFDRQFSATAVDQCLETLMRVHVYLFTHKDLFFIIQPTAYNDQCHLYGLRAVQIMRKFHCKTDIEKLAQSEENRFLHLSLLLSFYFIINPHHYIKMVKQGLKESKSPSLPKTVFSRFLTALASRGPKAAARAAYNQVFLSYAHRTVKSMQEREGATALDRELFTLFTRENLFLPARVGEGENPSHTAGVELYTPPKFAGVALLYNLLEYEKISFAFKVMVMTPLGTGIHCFLSQTPQENEPVIIFETFATDGSLSLQDCRKIASDCPRYHRKSPTLPPHPQATCLFCNPQKIDLAPFQERLTAAVQNPRRLLLALGADYILSTPVQAKYRQHFENQDRYPTLSALFQEAVQDIGKLGVSAQKPITLSVSFVYADRGAHAMNGKMLSCHPCSVLLQERGLIKGGQK